MATTKTPPPDARALAEKLLREAVEAAAKAKVVRLRQAIEEIFRGLQQELGWVGHRHRTRVRLLAHLALGMVAYGLVEL